MPTSVHVGKMIRTEFIREKLGDEEYQRWLVRVFGSTLMPTRVPLETLTKTLMVLDGELNGHHGTLFPMTFRAWFAEQPRERKKFVAFLKQRIADETPKVEPVEPANGHVQKTTTTRAGTKTRIVARRKRK